MQQNLGINLRMAKWSSTAFWLKHIHTEGVETVAKPNPHGSTTSTQNPT